MEQQKLVLQEIAQALGIRRALVLRARIILSSGVEATTIIIIAEQVHSPSTAAMVIPTATMVFPSTTTGFAQCV